MTWTCVGVCRSGAGRSDLLRPPLSGITAAILSGRYILKQQRGYAKAEALLADKWPGKYNSAGHLTWHGRLYGGGVVKSLFSRSRIYHGVWGSAPFQSLYEPSSGNLSSLNANARVVLSVDGSRFLDRAWGIVEAAVVVAGPLLVAGVSLTMIQAVRAGTRAFFHREPSSKFLRVRSQLLVAWLHLVQPAARLLGRVQHGLGPWSWRGFVRVVPLPAVHSLWSEQWDAPESRLSELERILKESGAAVISGGDFDPWDISISRRTLRAARVIAMVEEHGDGRTAVSLPDLAETFCCRCFSLSCTLCTGWTCSFGWGMDRWRSAFRNGSDHWLSHLRRLCARHVPLARRARAVPAPESAVTSKINCRRVRSRQNHEWVKRP